MDPVSLMDQIKAEIDNGTTEDRANIALAAFKASSKNLDLGTLAGFAAVFSRQEVILERLAKLQASLDELKASA